MGAPPQMPYLRTPDERFQDLPNFPYQPSYLQYGNLRMAYIDERTGGTPDNTAANRSNETFLCLHGQPTWSFLYRKMIPLLLNYTTTSTPPPPRRVVAPDLFGFGRSDKPTRDADYTFHFHRDALLHLVRTLDLTEITLVVQDWGGVLGLTLPLADPTRFRRLVVMNTTICVGDRPTQGFLDWRDYCNRTPDMPLGALLGRSCRHLSPAERDAYDAPYPSRDFKAGVRRFPNLIMVSKDMDGVDTSEESRQLYQTSNAFAAHDVLVVCGMQDIVLGPEVMREMTRVWKNGCYFAEIAEAGHFVQEWGEQVSRLAIGVFESQGAVEGVRKIMPGRAAL